MRSICGIILVVILLSVSVISVPEASAQEGAGEGKRTPIDTYPVPGEPGASRYSLADRWDHTDLTYYFDNCPSTVDCATAQDVVRQAFQAWDDVSALTFAPASSASAADIEVQWTAREEELGTPGGVLAFAYFPSYGGDLYLDDAEFWTMFGGDTDLYITAVHEIGHAIGLDHSDDESAIMYPYLLPLDGLGADDIAGIQRLYGPDEPTGSEPDVVTPDVPDDLPDGSTVEVVEGEIDNRGYYDVWTIDAHAGETVTITAETLSGDLDTYLALLTPDQQTVLAEDDDSLGGTNSQIAYTFPAADDYVIIVTRYDLDAGTTSGSYRLTAYRGGSAAPEEPETPSAVILTLSNASGATLCGVWISSSGSRDWGQDWLPTIGLSYLSTDEYAWWEVIPDTYDISVADCNGNTLEMYFLSVSEDTDVWVYPSGLVVP